MKMQKLKNVILGNSCLREIYFIVSHKKLNKNFINRKISKLYIKEHQFSKKKILDSCVISLTSYGERIKELEYTLYSLINQSVRPKRINVWLDEKQYSMDRLPEKLLIFQKFNVFFNFTKDIRAFTKLIPQIKTTPDLWILVCDDDVYYEKKWLERIWNEHEKVPNSIICNYAHEVKFDVNGNLMPYNKWETIKANSSIDSEYIFPCGFGGVLWNRKFFYEDITNEQLFMKLTPLNDDLWFYFMAILNKSPIHVLRKPMLKFKYVDIYKEYGLNDKHTLQAQNVVEGKNDIQITNIMNYYGIFNYNDFNARVNK